MKQILPVWTLYGEMLHTTLPLFRDMTKVGFGCFPMPAQHYRSSGVPLSSPNCCTHAELDSTLSVAGKHCFISCAAVLHKWHFWDSVLTECFASCYFCLSPCSFMWSLNLWTHFGFLSSSCCFLLWFSLFSDSLLGGKLNMSHRAASGGEGCASVTERKDSTL